MLEARFNESCIVGLPRCPYAFNSSGMAFIAAPADEEFSLELEILQNLLQEKEYEAYIALQRLDPAKFAFCTKICSKIIASQFCIVLLNASSHKDHPTIKIPNPNVHMEYGLMLAFKKHILPFQRDGEELAFNIRPLDTVMYSKSNFRRLADLAIDDAIRKVGMTTSAAPVIPEGDSLVRYMIVRGLRRTELNYPQAQHLAKIANPLGFLLLDGQDIVFFGIFETESAKEVIFRLKLLLQALSQEFESSKEMTEEQIVNFTNAWKRMSVEVIISDEADKEGITEKVESLTCGFHLVRWKVLRHKDVASIIEQEYAKIGDI